MNMSDKIYFYHGGTRRPMQSRLFHNLLRIPLRRWACVMMGGGRGGVAATSVADPDPNPDLLDPHVVGLPGPGPRSISQRYGSGSGSFYN